MPTDIKIKRSGSAVTPSSLGAGELAYSWEGTTGGKLFIGWGDENGDGEAPNISPIGGKYYTDLLSATAGTIDVSKAVILDASSKVNQWNVDDVTIDGNTISTTLADTTLLLSPNGTGTIKVPTGYKDRSSFSDSSLTSKEYVDGVAGSIVSDFTLSDGTNTDEFSTGQTLTFTGGTGLTSVVGTNTVTFNMDNTSVKYGGVSVSLGDSVAQPAFDLTSATNYPTSSLSGTITNAQLAGSITNAKLSNSAVTVTAGAGLGGGGSVNLGSSVSLSVNVDNSTLESDGSDTIRIKDGGVTNDKLANSSVAYTAGRGLTGGGGCTLGFSQLIHADVDSGDGDTIGFTTTGNSGKLQVKDGGITNAKLANSSVTVGTTEIALGASSTVLAGLTQIDVDNVRIMDNTISTTDAGDTTLYINPNPVGDSGTVIIQGDLTVRGTTTTINSEIVLIQDHALVLADSALNSAQADLAGLIIGDSTYSGRPTFLYNTTGDKWVSNKPIQVSNTAGLLFNGDSVSEIIDDRVNGLLSEGEGITLTYTDASNSLEIKAETATKDNLGVASFDSDHFGIATGHITIALVDGGTY